MCYNLSFFNNKQPQPVIGQGGSHETVPLVGQNPKDIRLVPCASGPAEHGPNLEAPY